MRHSVTDVPAIADSSSARHAALTHRRALAKALHLRSFYETTTDALLLSEPGGRILAANPGAQYMFGYSEAELLELNRGALSRESDQRYAAALAQRERDGVFTDELLYRRKNGELLHGLTTSKVLEDEDGDKVVSTIVRDVSEQRSLLKELRVSAARLRVTFYQAPVGIAEEDLAGRFLRVNTAFAKMLGYRATDLVSLNLMEIVHPDDRDRVKLMRERLTRGAIDHYTMEKRYVRRDGSTVWVNAWVALGMGLGETPQHTIAVVEDVTARKEVEELLWRANEALRLKNIELREANTAKDRFLASMSHELRTPLNSIIGFTGTMLMQLPGPLTPVQQEQLGVVQSSARHLLSLINDILDVARIESGKAAIVMEPLSITSVCKSVVDSVAAMAEQKQLGLETAFPSDVTVVTDHRALQQILLNLASNAIKYTERGFVRISFVAGEKSVEIRVADSGIGIRSEDQARLFQPFEQLDSTAARRWQGVGLGLHLSRRLSELIGATLGVSSAFGEGSTFTLSLPLHAPAI